MVKPNLLIYSNDSIGIINYLKKSGDIKLFKLIKYEDNKQSKVMNIIKELPSAVIPELKKVIVGDEIINYVNSKKQKMQINEQQINKQINKQAQEQRKQLNNGQLVKQTQEQVNQVNNHQSREPLGYIANEMDGYSDKYSYLNTTLMPSHCYGRYKN